MNEERKAASGWRARMAAMRSLPLAPPPHAPQQALGHVLQRQVEVRHAGRADGVDEPVVELGGIEVEEAGARHPLGDLVHQGNDRAGGAHVSAVGRQVLGDEHDLLGLEGLDLGEDRLACARTLLASERRDGAEAAVAVAPLGHLHVRPRGSALRPRQVQQVERRDVSARPERDRHAETGDGVGLGQGLGQLGAVALGHAAGHHEAGVGPPGLAQGQDRVDRLLAGGLDEGAGVDHDDVGLVGGVRRHEPVGQHRPRQLVGVDLVLRAAEGLHPKGVRHETQSYRST